MTPPKPVDLNAIIDLIDELSSWDGDLLSDAISEIEYLRARVKELEDDRR